VVLAVGGAIIKTGNLRFNKPAVKPSLNSFS